VTCSLLFSHHIPKYEDSSVINYAPWRLPLQAARARWAATARTSRSAVPGPACPASGACPVKSVLVRSPLLLTACPVAGQGHLAGNGVSFALPPLDKGS